MGEVARIPGFYPSGCGNSVGPQARPTTLASLSGISAHGFTPTVIERAPQLRAGGYPIDVRLEAVQVAKLMGSWPGLQLEQTTLGEISFVNERHQRSGRINLQAGRKALEALDGERSAREPP